MTEFLNSVLLMIIQNLHGVTWTKGKSSKCRLGEEQAYISASSLKVTKGFLADLFKVVRWCKQCGAGAVSGKMLRLMLQYDEVVTDTRVGYWGVMQALVETTKEKQLHNTWVNRIFSLPQSQDDLILRNHDGCLKDEGHTLWSKWYQE